MKFKMAEPGQSTTERNGAMDRKQGLKTPQGIIVVNKNKKNYDEKGEVYCGAACVRIDVTLAEAKTGGDGWPAASFPQIPPNFLFILFLPSVRRHDRHNPCQVA